MNTALTVGIVGHGLIGRTHAQALAAVDGATLSAIVSRSGRPVGQALTSISGTSSASAGSPDVRWFTRLEELLAAEAPDVVAICTPPQSHADQVRAALEHGAHVLVEKPPASTVAELRELIALARVHGRQLAVVSQSRLQPQLTYLADVVRSGGLGAPLLGEVRLHWHRDQDYYDSAPWRAADSLGGSLPNQGWHAVDVLVWLLGGADTVAAQVATLAHRIDVEDTAVATVRFCSGALGSIVTTTATPPGEPAETRLYFERGTVRLQDTRIVEWSAPPDVPPPPGQDEAGSGAADPAAIGAEGHRRQWQDLVDAIRTGGRPAVTAVDALPTLSLIEACYRSAATGDSVAIPAAIQGGGA